jgi:hypothetical protein
MDERKSWFYNNVSMKTLKRVDSQRSSADSQYLVKTGGGNADLSVPCCIIVTRLADF